MAEIGQRGQHVDGVNTRSGDTSEVMKSKEPARPRLRSLKPLPFVYLRRRMTQFNLLPYLHQREYSQFFNSKRYVPLISIELIILIRSNKSLKLRNVENVNFDFSFLFSTMNTEKQERSILFVAGIFVGSKRYVPLISIELIILRSNKSLKLRNVENVNFYLIFLFFFFNCNDEH